MSQTWPFNKQALIIHLRADHGYVESVAYMSRWTLDELVSCHRQAHEQASNG